MHRIDYRLSVHTKLHLHSTEGQKKKIFCTVKSGHFFFFNRAKTTFPQVYFYLSSQARRLLAAPISSTTEVRKSLGGLREALPS